MTLTGPSKTVVVEPLKTPERERPPARPQPAPAPAPRQPVRR